MSLNVSKIKAITIDSYSTLLDVDSAAGPLKAIIDNADEVAQLWRRESLVYGMLCNFYESYESFYELNRQALQYALNVYDITLTEDQIEQILSIYHQLEVFTDVREGVKGLRDMGYPVYVLSNGDPGMLKSLVKIARIDDLINDFISVEEIQKYKPAKALYAHGASRAGVAIEDVVHISAGWFDVAGAQQAGMQGIWMNRKAETPRVFGPKPELEVTGFEEVIAVLKKD